MMITNTEQVWQNCLREIESQVSKANFGTWFKSTAIIKDDEGTVYISVPNEFVKEWLVTKYQRMILKTLVDYADHVRAIEFIVQRFIPANERTMPPETIEKPELPLKDLYVNRDDNLNPRYTFDRFIVGSFNELAYAAAQAIIKRPQQAYNPLFIYGSSGLGKTHLLQAIGNEIKKNDLNKKVLYTTLEKFQNDYVSSVQNNRSPAFREKYRQYNVMIIDDIQFISGKEKTQEELFHLFNTLYEQGKNIIFSSDKHPNHIIGLEDRLKTRFNAGMTIDIQEPDLESRMAIIREKISQNNVEVEDEVCTYIAQAVTGSIREIEGVVNTVTMHAQMKGRLVTLQDVRTLIKHSVKPKKNISLETIVKLISEYYNLEDKLIYEKTRRKEIVRARQMVMYVLREDFNESYPSIGMKLGGKDHTTVIHSYEKIKSELTHDAMLMKELEDIRILFK